MSVPTNQTKPISDCKKTDCSKSGAGIPHEHKFTESHLKKLPRAEVLRVVEGIAKNRNEEVPEEIQKLANSQSSSRTEKIKKYSLYVFLGIIVLLLVLSLVTPAAPVGAGLLGGIVAGGGIMEVLLPMLVLVPGFMAGGMKIKGNVRNKQDKQRMIEYALQLQQKDPELYGGLGGVGELAYNQLMRENSLEDVINTIQNQNPLTQNQLSRFQASVVPDMISPTETPASVRHSTQRQDFSSLTQK
jgi:hypothetical protein